MAHFTPEEESKILTCIANHVAICCRGRADLRRRLVPALGPRRALADFAHQCLGCEVGGLDQEYDDERWDDYLERTIEWLLEQS